METEFTPYLSLIGGMLIGLAAVLFLLLNGQIAGVSGILQRFLPPLPESNHLFEGIAFVVGLGLALPLYLAFGGGSFEFHINGGFITIIIAGLLVGAGTAIGSGCTSGHGVCGISRLSSRSIIATATFMTTGVITVFLLRHVWGG